MMIIYDEYEYDDDEYDNNYDDDDEYDDGYGYSI